jgi:hypothetical protein
MKVEELFVGAGDFYKVLNDYFKKRDGNAMVIRGGLRPHIPDGKNGV